MTYTYEEARNESLKYFNGDALAAEVFCGKYALQDLGGIIYESNPSQMHRRLAKEFARIECKYKNPLSEEEIYDLLSDWTVVPQGGPMSAIGNKFQTQSLSNCFVIESPYDSYGGILKTDQELVQIAKRRGGVGFDISTIRPKGLEAANAARTTDGIGVFMERFSNSCREVAQGGRRGALLLSISVHHPEVSTFANIKRDRLKVTGANVSIRVTDEFLHAVKNGTMYKQRFPVEENVPHLIEKEVDARTVWNDICSAMRDCSEPGMLFWDTIKTQSPSDAYESVGFGTVSTNPCLSGDTKIAVADGRNYVTIKQLADEGYDVPVYAYNNRTGKITILQMRNPRLTGENLPVYKVILEGGHSFKATGNHTMIMRDGTRKQVDELQNGDQLWTAYKTAAKFNEVLPGMKATQSQDYWWVKDCNSHSWKAEHRLVCEQNNDIPNELGMKHTTVDNRVISTLTKALEQGYAADIVDGKVVVEKKCEWCEKSFTNFYDKREISFCSPSCSNLYANRKAGKNIVRAASNRALFDKNAKNTKNAILDCYTELRFKNNKLPTQIELRKLCSERKISFRYDTKRSFKNWQEVVQAAETHNHRVISVELCGSENVYNGTVDFEHTLCIALGEEKLENFKNNATLLIASEQCGEITLGEYDACRLMLINLSKFVVEPFTSHAFFDYYSFGSVVRKAQRLMDDLIDLEIEAIDKIITKVKSDPEPDFVKAIELTLWENVRKTTLAGRRTGLGITALADTFAYLNLKYGEEETIEVTNDIYRTLAINSYRSSVIMAFERGAFEAYDYELEKNHPFINRIMNEDSELFQLYRQVGRRNIANLTTAPAGSTSILTQTSSGCEPVLFVKARRKRKITSADKLARVDEVDKLGDSWQYYDVYHNGVEKWMSITNNNDVQNSPYNGSTIEDIDWKSKIDIQAAAQKWICHSISNTTSFPNDVTVDTIKDLCMHAWETGCKGVTVYRTGSRDAVIVKDDEAKKQQSSVPSIIETNAPKRPKELSCDIHRVSIQGEQYIILVGTLDNRPYEVFAGLQELVEVPKKFKKGVLRKSTKKDGIASYNLSIPVGEDEEILFKDVVNLFNNSTYGAFTRTLSLALRHGVPVSYIVEQLRKDKHSEITSFSASIARVLSKGYIPDGTKVSSDACPQCGSKLTYIQGCVSCASGCGWSKCG